MKNPITNAQLKFNCPVNWDSMEDTSGGKNCHQCKKKVFDLTNCSQDEMDVILIQNNYNVCAKFTSQQMALQPINHPVWKKWISAAMVLIGFSVFNEKVVAQNTTPSTEQKSPNSSSQVWMGQVYIAPENMPINATPTIGVEAFNNSVRKLVTKKEGTLLVSIDIDKSSNIKDAIVIHSSELKIDSLTEKKISEMFKKAKWNPSTRRGKATADSFVYAIPLKTN